MAIQTELLARVRSILNETGVSSGFWDDSANLYRYMDMGQNNIIDSAYFLSKKMTEAKEDFTPEVLKPLIKSKTFAITIGTTEYSITGSPISLNDYRHIYALELLYDDRASDPYYPATELSKAEQIFRKQSYILASSVKDPTFSRYGVKINISPAPTLNVTSGGILYYTMQPPAIASGQDKTLGNEADNALIYYTCAEAFAQDENMGMANLYKGKYEAELIKLLV